GAMLAHVASLLAPAGILACDELAAGVVKPEPWDDTFAKATRVVAGGAKRRRQDLGVSVRLGGLLAPLGQRPTAVGLVQPFVPFEVKRRTILLALAEVLPAALDEQLISETAAQAIADEVRGLPSTDCFVLGTCHLQIASRRGP